MNTHQIKGIEDPYWKATWTIYRLNFPKGERRLLIEPFSFVEHLAIGEGCKGKGIGSRILENLKDMPGRLILEIDPPENPVAIRRKGFYERAGFVLNSYLHLNMPLRVGMEICFCE